MGRAYDRIHESNGMSPSPDDNRDSICFWNSILLLERRKIGLSHSISAFESVKPLSKSASKYDFNSFQLVLFRVQKRTRYIILIPCTRIILENTFIQGNVKLTRAYIRRKRITQTVAKNAVTGRKRSTRKPPGVRSQTRYIQPVTRAKDGLYHIGFTQRVTPVTGDNWDTQNQILERVCTALRINSCGIRKREARYPKL